MNVKTLVSHQRLLEVLAYDASTGLFTWKKALSNRGPVGRIAGRPLSKDYWRVRIDGVDYSAHRLAWFYVRGKWPSHEIDHINRVKNDNRIANLREATRAENHQNRDRYASNKSGITGVHWDKRSDRWIAAIRVNGKKVQLGVFQDKVLAGEAYAEAKRKEHPFSAPAQTVEF